MNYQKYLYIIFCSIIFTILVAFKAGSDDTRYASAEVSRIDGLLIFSDSKPIMQHDTLGIVELGFISGTQYETIRTNLIKRTKKKHSEADGIILALNKKGLDICYAIKFK
jgi:hypothetical protein